MANNHIDAKGRCTIERYPEISEHGLIADLQTAARISTDGTIDWLCCPRFDSPSIFGSLLDHYRGGHFRIGPDWYDYMSRQLYFPDTAILITRFMSPEGVSEGDDFMPVIESKASDCHRRRKEDLVASGSNNSRSKPALKVVSVTTALRAQTGLTTSRSDITRPIDQSAGEGKRATD